MPVERVKKQLDLCKQQKRPDPFFKEVTKCLDIAGAAEALRLLEDGDQRLVERPPLHLRGLGIREVWHTTLLEAISPTPEMDQKSKLKPAYTAPPVGGGGCELTVPMAFIGRASSIESSLRGCPDTLDLSQRSVFNVRVWKNGPRPKSF